MRKKKETLQEAHGRNQQAFLRLWKKLAETQSLFRLLPLVRKVWRKVGEVTRLVLPAGWNQSCRVFGALNVCTGGWVWQIVEKVNGSTLLAFLERLRALHPGQLIYGVVDRATWHRSMPVQE